MVEDAAGDGYQPRLDITEVRVRNKDHALVYRISFMRAGRGFLLVQLQDRDGDGALAQSLHRPRGVDRNSFDSGATGSCDGLAVTWDHELDTARVRIPSTCFQDGDYGAIRSRVFTETADDNDFAPNGDTQWRWTRFVARG